MRSLERALRKKNTVIGNDAYRVSHDACKATHQRRPVKLFELMETAAINDTSDNLVYIIALTVILWNNAIQIERIITRRLRCMDIPGNIFAMVEIGHDAAANRQCMLVIQSIVISDARG